MFRLSRVLRVLVLAALPFPLAAQAELIFTNDASALKNASSLRDSKELAVFSASDPVWGVLRTNGKFPDVSGFTRLKDGNRVVTVVILDYKDVGPGPKFYPMDSVDIRLSSEDLAKQTFTFVVIPNSFDRSAPAFEKLIDKFKDAGKGRALVAVRVDPDNEENTIRSGFYVDLSKGLGQYADWQTQLNSSYAANAAEREKPLIATRTAFFAAYRSKLTDPAFDKKFPAWWKAHMDAQAQLIRANTASLDWSFVRNDVGIVQSKRVTVLYAYRRTDSGKCFIEWQQFGYESLGGGAFDTQLKYWTPSDQVFNVEREPLDAGRGYEVACAGIHR